MRSAHAARTTRPMATATAPDRTKQPQVEIPSTSAPLQRIRKLADNMFSRVDVTLLLLGAIILFAFGLRIYGLNWDVNNHLHPDEREIVFQAMCLAFPGGQRVGNCVPAYTGPNWFFNIASPLNPHFFAYGSFPLYLLAVVAHGLAWLTHITGGAFRPTDGGAFDDFNHFTLIGRALSALFDTGSVLLSGLIARRLMGRWAGVLAAAFVAVIPFNVQVSHFYAVDTVLLFFVLLTLLACIMLAQSKPRWRPSDSNDEEDDYYDAQQPRETLASVWGAWGLGVFVGMSFALAMSTKVSALPLLAPILFTVFLVWRRRGFEPAALALAGIMATGIVTFMITSPYALIDLKDFQAQVQEQTQLSQGLLDYPYVRQFANTTPYVYEIQQMLLYDMGLALGLAGLAGFAWAAWRVWRSVLSEWTILVIWLIGYFAVIGDAYTKFTRYMLPVFAPLAICAACAIVAFAAWGMRRLTSPPTPPPHGEGRKVFPARRFLPLPSYGKGVGGIGARFTELWGVGWWRVVCVALALTIFACTAFEAFALDNIYSTLNTRVQASIWLYDHLTPGSTVTYEVWDDPLPIEAPPAYTRNGIGYTAEGHPILPGEYNQVGLNLYDADTPVKAAQMAQTLASANAVIISSQRLLRSIPKLPDRYPMTIRYYQLLFAGKLGFHLAYHVENHPNLFGITLNDTGADESFSVYDHPPVWIFMRTGAGLNANQIQTMLTQGLTLPPASSRAGSQKPLTLSPQDAAADAQSPSLAAQFPPNSLPNQIPLLWWLLIVELLGIIAFPLTFHVFPGLYDRGWGLTKLLGILLLAYMVWLPSSLNLLPFDSWAVALMFGVLAAIGAGVAWLRREAIWSFVRARWRILVTCEALFLIAFLFFTWIRAQDPDLWHIYRGGEKPMEFAFLNAILRSRFMPPYDPWYSGGYINYYYYGQYLVAVLIKLTGIVPAVAFNLALPLLFGMTFTGAFSVVAGLTRRWWAGLVGGIALVVMGNLDGLWQEIARWQDITKGLTPPNFDYWASSRVIPYTINEFPYWSFLYGDLHAHLIDLPVTVFLIACCASLLGVTSPLAPPPNGEANDGWQGERVPPASVESDGSASTIASPSQHGKEAGGIGWRSVAPTLAAAALALGAAWCINTWDLPTYALLLAAALALAVFFVGRPKGKGARTGWRAIYAGLTWPAIRTYGLALVLTFGAAYALYFPFHSNFQNFTSGTGTVTTPTNPAQFFTLFGIWLFLAGSFLTLELRDRVEEWLARGHGEDTTQPGWRPTLDTPAALIRLVEIGLINGVVLYFAYLASLKALLFIMFIEGLFLGLNPRNPPLKLLTYALLVLGLGVALGVEFIYVRDFLDNSLWERMNTVFKFYYQVWTLLALSGALVFAQILPRVVGEPVVATQTASDEVRQDAYYRDEEEGAGEADAADETESRLWAEAPDPDEEEADDWEDERAPVAAGKGFTLPGWATGVSKGVIKGVWLLTLAALLAGSSIFLFAGTQIRLQDPQEWALVSPPPGGIQPQGLSLDGMAYMRGWYPQDYAAITWMNQHIAGDPTIVEASNGPYQWYGRVSIYTGLPSVLGWSSHESQQRYPDQVYARQDDVQNFYGTPDPGAALAFLHTYNVKYVYVGVLEETCYVTDPSNNCVPMSAAALAKFTTLTREGKLRAVYHSQQTTIYEVTG